MIEFLSQPWPWYVAGPLIALTMAMLLWFGKSFGFSSNLRTICSIGGAGAVADFFDFDWKSQIWNLVFLVGAIFGGFIAAQYLTNNNSLELSASTIGELEHLGFDLSEPGYLPNEIFGRQALDSISGIGILLLGGFLVGFGSRYAGGCTSGHAISGLSNLQIPSLIAVVGFFIGGLLMVHVLMPLLF